MSTSNLVTSTLPRQTFSLSEFLPGPVKTALDGLTEQRHGLVWFSGGSVRDWLRGVAPRDIDLTVEKNAAGFAKALAEACGGTLITLDRDWDIYRVFSAGMDVDVSSFREGAQNIEEELFKRDFTVNAMAIPFTAPPIENADNELLQYNHIIDPTGGRSDLVAGIVRATSRESLLADPLRLLRAYRFSSSLGFVIAPETEALIVPLVKTITSVAAERVNAELGLLMTSGRAAGIIRAMVDSGLLWEIIPELLEAHGMEQPASHHLDVFGHSLAALEHMERILRRPETFFPESASVFTEYLAVEKRRFWLVWAALLHDLGKPATRVIRKGRITFYQHDQKGAEMFTAVAARLKWSREASREVERLIANHMWPFHLGNVQRAGCKVSPRACLKLVKAMNEEFPGLFLLAMADSLAGDGPGKPADTEESVAAIFLKVEEIYRERILPIARAPRLLNGHDLMERFGITAGPALGRILSALEEAQVAGEVKDLNEALAWVEQNFPACSPHIRDLPATQ